MMKGTDKSIEQNVDASGSVRDITQIGVIEGDLNLQIAEGVISAETLIATLLQAAKIIPAPSFTDLFEIIRESAEVRAAVFRTADNHNSAPYESPYFPMREAAGGTQGLLYKALTTSRGALLVESRAGLGKTREVAELATRLCEDGWTICVAKGEGDARLAALDAFPDVLRGCKLLFIFDDLHRRVTSGPNQQHSYAERLESLLKFFDRDMAPGEFYVIATTRNEPHHQKQLGFDSAVPPWERFDVYELPEFPDSELQSILVAWAEWANVKVKADDIEQMLRDSDRTIRTVFENIEQARRHKKSLSLEYWLPSQGRTWDVRFAEAAARWPEVALVYRTLYLIREAGLPTRFDYVLSLAAKLESKDITAAAEGLVNMGLLGLRNMLLDTFGDEQLADRILFTGAERPKPPDHVEAIINTVIETVKANPAWLHDLIVLSNILLTSGWHKEAEITATEVIGLGEELALAYFTRGKARFALENAQEAGADFTQAITYGQDDPIVYFFRGITRFQLEDFVQAESDFVEAIDNGFNNGYVYGARGINRIRLKDAAGAEADLTAALAFGENLENYYFARAQAREQRGDYVGAGEDYTKAIEHGFDEDKIYYFRGFVLIAAKDFARGEADLTEAIKRGEDNAHIYYLRGYSRAAQENYQGAESDSGLAIAKGKCNALVYYIRGFARAHVGNQPGAEADFTEAINKGRDDAGVYWLRAEVRGRLGNYAGVEKDLTEAITRGANDVNTYLLRGAARAELADSTGARDDFTAAINRGIKHAGVYFARGVANHIEDPLAAEADYTSAIEYGMQDSLVYNFRGQTRHVQGKYKEADADYTAALKGGYNDLIIHLNRAFTSTRIGHLDIARDDCLQASREAPDALLTYRAWGDLHLAEREYDKAESRFHWVLENEPEGWVYFKLGLVYLLTGRFAEANTAYFEGIISALTTEVESALEDLQFWMARQSDRVASDDAERAISDIHKLFDAYWMPTN